MKHVSKTEACLGYQTSPRKLHRGLGHVTKDY